MIQVESRHYLKKQKHQTATLSDLHRPPTWIWVTWLIEGEHLNKSCGFYWDRPEEPDWMLWLMRCCAAVSTSCNYYRQMNDLIQVKLVHLLCLQANLLIFSPQLPTLLCGGVEVHTRNKKAGWEYHFLCNEARCMNSYHKNNSGNMSESGNLFTPFEADNWKLIIRIKIENVEGAKWHCGATAACRLAKGTKIRWSEEVQKQKEGKRE